MESEKPKEEEAVIPQEPLKENKKLTISDFELLKTVGQGSFGKVFQVAFCIFELELGPYEGKWEDLCYEGSE